MAKGLDELIEWLIAEIAYGGPSGLRIADFIEAANRYNGAQRMELAAIHDGGRTRAPAALDDEPDMSLVRKVWQWTVAREEVLVGPDGAWNHLSLDDALALPEDQLAASSFEPIGKGKATGPPTKPARSGTRPKKAPSNPTDRPAARPRLFVSEASLWMTITGHDIDPKRVPPLEFACLVGIASTKQEGIVQADLRELVKQDKRSVPRRTDFLAQKGYIAKRTTVTRGFKTSRLWLKGFAPAELPAAGSSAPGSLTLDLSPDALRKDFEPVPWRHRWTGDNIEYTAFAQTFLAIIKAFGVMRLVNLKSKMGVLGLKWQMKVLSKECRRFAAFGVLKYVAATMVNDRKVFKDCIKYVRDPTKEEFQLFLDCGKKTSKYSDQTGHRQPLLKVKAAGKPAKGPAAQASGNEDLGEDDNDRVYSSLWSSWTPEKPLVNTLVEEMQRAGPDGISNPKISILTVGFSYRRYLFPLMQQLSSRQPEHLRHLQIGYNMVRKGKTTAYMFKATASQDVSDKEVVDQQQAQASQESRLSPGETRRAASSPSDPFGFPAVPQQLVNRNGQNTLSDLSRAAQQMPSYMPKKVPKSDKEAAPVAEGPGTPGETSTVEARASASPHPAGVQTASTPQPNGVKVPEPRQPAVASTAPDVAETQQDDPRPMVAYRQLGLLPAPPKRGRRKKSLVLTFKSDRLKEAGFLESSLRRREHPSGSKSAAGTTLELGNPVPDTLLPDGSPHIPETFAAHRLEATNRHQIRDAAATLPCPQRASNSEPSIRLNSVDSSHNGSTGRLSIAGDKVDVRFDYDAEDVAMNPLVIPICSLMGNPAGTGKKIVLEVKGESGDLTGPLVFHVKDPKDQRQAVASFREAVAGIRNADGENQPVTQKPGGSAAPKGQKKPKGRAAYKKSKSYLCETCGGSWKNDLGLKYHLTKSMSRCNPKYTAMPEEVRPRKRRKIDRGLDDFDLAQSSDLAPPTTRRSGKASRPSVKSSIAQKAVYSIDNEWGATPRGLPHGNAQFSLLEDRPALSHNSVRPRPTGEVEQLASESRLTQHMDGSGALTPEISSSLRQVDRSILLVGHPVPKTESDMEHPLPGTTKASTAGAIGGHGTWGEQAAKDGGQENPTVTAPEPALYIVEPAFDPAANNGMATAAAKERHHAGSEPSAPPATRLAEDCIMMDSEATDAPDGHEPPTAEPAISNAEEQFAMPCKSDMTKMTALVLKTHRISEIIRFLLRRTEGVFPSGKVLLYAVSAVYAKAFPDDDEPQSRGCTAAIKAMEGQKEIEEHHFAFRDSEGMFNSYQLLVRSDVGVAAPTVVAMKKNVQESHPRFYFPPGFAPAEDDLEVLEALESEQSRRERKKGRRMLPNEVEVLDAPIYEVVRKVPRKRKARGGLLASIRDPNQQRSLKRKASAGDLAGLFPKKARQGARGGTRLLAPAIQAGAVLDGIIGPAPMAQGEARAPGGLNHEQKREGGDGPNQTLEPDLDSSDGSDEELGPHSLEIFGDLAKEATERERNAGHPFTDCIVLECSTTPGSWDLPSQRFFEQHGDRSFTMRGWMPSMAVIFRENLPQSMEDIRDITKSTFDATQWIDPRWGMFYSHVQWCRKWELSEHGSQLFSGTLTTIPQYVFLNFSSPELRNDSRPLKLHWLDYNQHTLDSPLDASRFKGGEDKVDGRGGRGGRRGRGSRGGRGGRRQRPPRERKILARREPEPKLPVFTRQRDLTMYPEDPRDYFQDAEVDEKPIDWKAEDTRIAAIVAVRVLLGGVNKKVDWGIVMRLFPGLSPSGLKKFWPTISKQRASYIEKLTEKFQREFLVAYEKGDLPPLDYDDILAYDWRRLVTWTVRLVLHDVPNLPASREGLHRDFSFHTEQYPAPGWQESFFQTTRSVWNRFQDSSSQAAFKALEPARRAMGPEALARSWIRALSCTAVDKYSPAIIRQKMLKLGDQNQEELNQLLDGVIKRLQRQRILKRSKAKALRTGRPYTLSEPYLTNLAKYSQVEKFVQARAFKARLDEAFRNDGAVLLDYASNDGSIMALLNLQANRRVRFEGIDVPYVPFGFEPGNYESRKFPKQYHHFRQRVLRTDRYLFTEDIAALESVKQVPPPGEGPEGELPIWCDFFGQVDTHRWTAMLGAVIFLAATRGIMKAKHISEATKLVIDPFEVDVMLAWAVRCSLLTPAVTEGALMVSEWWWLIVANMYEQEGIGIGLDAE